MLVRLELLLIVLLSLPATVAAEQAPPVELDRVVGVVGDRPILATEVRLEAELRSALLAGLPPGRDGGFVASYGDPLDIAAGRALADRVARGAIQPSPERVAELLSWVISGLGGQSGLDALLDRWELTYLELEGWARELARFEAVLELQILLRVEVSDAQVEQAWELGRFGAEGLSLEASREKVTEGLEREARVAAYERWLRELSRGFRIELRRPVVPEAP